MAPSTVLWERPGHKMVNVLNAQCFRRTLFAIDRRSMHVEESDTCFRGQSGYFMWGSFSPCAVIAEFSGGILSSRIVFDVQMIGLPLRHFYVREEIKTKFKVSDGSF